MAGHDGDDPDGSHGSDNNPDDDVPDRPRSTPDPGPEDTSEAMATEVTETPPDATTLTDREMFGDAYADNTFNFGFFEVLSLLAAPFTGFLSLAGLAKTVGALAADKTFGLEKSFTFDVRDVGLNFSPEVDVAATPGVPGTSTGTGFNPGDPDPGTPDDRDRQDGGDRVTILQRSPASRGSQVAVVQAPGDGADDDTNTTTGGGNTDTGVRRRSRARHSNLGRYTQFSRGTLLGRGAQASRSASLG